jgi:hypothetical protein
MARGLNPGDDYEKPKVLQDRQGRGFTMRKECTRKQRLLATLFNVFAIAFIQPILEPPPPVYIDSDTPQLTETESAAKAEFIEQLIEEGGFAKAVENDHPGAWATPRFLALDFDTQKNFMRCRSERPATAATSVWDCLWSSPS